LRGPSTTLGCLSKIVKVGPFRDIHLSEHGARSGKQWAFAQPRVGQPALLVTLGLGSDALLDVSYLHLDRDDRSVPAVIARQKVGFPLQGVRELGAQYR
jgi:hypothetical protein